jgi:hypothetical protein
MPLSATLMRTHWRGPRCELRGRLFVRRCGNEEPLDDDGDGSADPQEDVLPPPSSSPSSLNVGGGAQAAAATRTVPPGGVNLMALSAFAAMRNTPTMVRLVS